MSDVGDLRGFVMEALSDAGADVRDEGGVLWVTSPESVRTALEIPETACLVFEPERAGEFGAELVAPGSYLLERILGLVMSRGRWNRGTVADPPADWLADALRGAGLPADASVPGSRVETLAVFAFRITLVSDEKRESFHYVATSLDGRDSWEAPVPQAEAALLPWDAPGASVDLEAAYRAAGTALLRRTQASVEAFRKTSLAALEEEVRRIFSYFDGTVKEIRASAPTGTDDLVRALGGERDRRLTEAVERFDPHATATLCGVRLVRTPVADVLVRLGKDEVPVTVDAFTRVPRGLRCKRCETDQGPWNWTEDAGLLCRACSATAAGSVPLPARPPSDTPRPRRPAGGGAARSPRGSTGRSQSASSRRRRP